MKAKLPSARNKREPTRRPRQKPPQPQPRRNKCRICGCTNARACPGGCHWIENDLCSRCLPEPKKPRKLTGMVR